MTNFKSPEPIFDATRIKTDEDAINCIRALSAAYFANTKQRDGEKLFKQDVRDSIERLKKAVRDASN